MRRLLSALVFFLASGWCFGQEGPTFVQMSDPQFGMYTENLDFAQETANFEFAIATANRLRPAFVIVCGDLVNQAGNAAQIAEFQRIAHKLQSGIALYAVAGNHDVGNEPTPESLAAYRSHFGKDYYTFTYPGFEGIVLDSSLIQHPDRAPEDAARQEQWLKEQLAAARQAKVPRVVVFQHIPFFVHDAEEPDSYFNIPKSVRAKYLDLLSAAGVEYVFAGHLHYAAAGESGPLHMISAGPVGKPLGTGASGLRIVRIGAAGLEQQWFDFGHLPTTIESAFSGAAGK